MPKQTGLYCDLDHSGNRSIYPSTGIHGACAGCGKIYVIVHPTFRSCGRFVTRYQLGARTETVIDDNSDREGWAMDVALTIDRALPRAAKRIAAALSLEPSGWEIYLEITPLDTDALNLEACRKWSPGDLYTESLGGELARIKWVRCQVQAYAERTIATIEGRI